MKTELQDLWDRFKQFQLDLHGILQGIPSAAATMQMPDMIDCGFICREMSKIAEDLKISADKQQAVLGKCIAMLASVAHSQGSELELRGELASATPEMKMKPKMPHPFRDKAEYDRLMLFIGVTPDQLKSGLLRPSFTGIEEELTRRAQLGEKIPPEIQVAFTEIGVVYRKRKLKGQDNGNQEEF